MPSFSFYFDVKLSSFNKNLTQSKLKVCMRFSIIWTALGKKKTDPRFVAPQAGFREV